MDELKKYADLCEAQQRSIDNYARVINALKDDFDKLQGAVLAEREACAITAWSIGIDLHLKHHDIREVGSACATAIRARGNA